jgi:hypothetical protein
LSAHPNRMRKLPARLGLWGARVGVSTTARRSNPGAFSWNIGSGPVIASARQTAERAE